MRACTNGRSGIMSAFRGLRSSEGHDFGPGRSRMTRCGHFALLPKQPFKCDPRMGSRSEPEAAQTPFRDMPMRQGEIRGSCPADSDRLLLLHELPRSRTSVRAVGFCAARARCGQWNRRYPISKGSSAMRDGAGVSRRASAQARFLDPTGRCHVLQFGNDPRRHQRALAVDVPEPLSDRRAAT